MSVQHWIRRFHGGVIRCRIAHTLSQGEMALRVINILSGFHLSSRRDVLEYSLTHWRLVVHKGLEKSKLAHVFLNNAMWDCSFMKPLIVSQKVEESKKQSPSGQ